MILRSKQNCLLLAALCASLLCASSCLRDPSFDNSSAVKFKAFARSSSAAATKTQYAGGNVATGQKERPVFVNEAPAFYSGGQMRS